MSVRRTAHHIVFRVLTKLNHNVLDMMKEVCAGLYANQTGILMRCKRYIYGSHVCSFNGSCGEVLLERLLVPVWQTRLQMRLDGPLWV